MSLSEDRGLLALTSAEARHWLVSAAGQVAEAVAAKATRTESPAAEDVNGDSSSPQPTKIEALKAMRAYQAARARCLATRAHNPAFRSRATWMPLLGTADEAEAAASERKSSSGVEEVFATFPTSAFPVGESVDFLQHAVSDYLNQERFSKNGESAVIPPFVLGMANAVESAVASLLNRPSTPTSLPRVTVEDLQLAVQYAAFNASNQRPSPLVKCLLEAALEAGGSSASLEVAGAILIRRLAEIMNLTLSPSSQTYNEMLKCFSECVASTEGFQTNLDCVVTIAESIDRLSRYVAQTSSRHAPDYIRRLLRDEHEQPTHDIALKQIFAACAIDAMQLRTAPSGLASLPSEDSDDEAEDAALRSAAIQFLSVGTEDTTSTAALVGTVVRQAFRQEWERLGKRATDSVPMLASQEVVNNCLLSLNGAIERLVSTSSTAESVQSSDASTLGVSLRPPEGDAPRFVSTTESALAEQEEEYLSTDAESPETVDIKTIAECAMAVTSAPGGRAQEQVLARLTGALRRVVKSVFKAACDCRLFDVELAEHTGQYALLQILAQMGRSCESPLEVAARQILNEDDSCDVCALHVRDASTSSGSMPDVTNLRALHDTVMQVTLLVAESKIPVKHTEDIPRVLVVNCRSESSCVNADYARFLVGERASCLNMLPGGRHANAIEVLSPMELVGRLLDAVQSFPCEDGAHITRNPMFNVAAVILEDATPATAPVVQLCKSYLTYWRSVVVAHAAMMPAKGRLCDVPSEGLPSTSFTYFDGVGSSLAIPTFQLVVTTRCAETFAAVDAAFGPAPAAGHSIPQFAEDLSPVKAALLKRLFANGPVSNDLQQVLALDAAKRFVDVNMHCHRPLIAAPVDVAAIRRFAVVSHVLAVGTPTHPVSVAENHLCLPMPLTNKVGLGLAFASLDGAVALTQPPVDALSVGERLTTLQRCEEERAGLRWLSDHEGISKRRAQWLSKLVNFINGSTPVSSVVVIVAEDCHGAEKLAGFLRSSCDGCVVSTELTSMGTRNNSLTVAVLSPNTVVQLPVIATVTTEVQIIAVVDASIPTSNGSHLLPTLYNTCAPWGSAALFVSLNIEENQTSEISGHAVIPCPVASDMPQEAALRAQFVSCIAKSIDRFTSTAVEATLFDGLHATMYRDLHRQSYSLFQSFVLPKLAPLIAASQAVDSGRFFAQKSTRTPVTDMAAKTVCSLVLPSITADLQKSSWRAPVSPVSNLRVSIFAGALVGGGSAPHALTSLYDTLTPATSHTTHHCTASALRDLAEITPYAPSGRLPGVLRHVAIPADEGTPLLELHALLVNMQGSLKWSPKAVNTFLANVADESTSAHVFPNHELVLAVAKHVEQPTRAIRSRGFMRSLLSCDVYRQGHGQSKQTEGATEVWRDSNAAKAAGIPRRAVGRHLKGEPRAESDVRKRLQTASREVDDSVPQQTQLAEWIRSALAHTYAPKTFLPVAFCLQQLLLSAGVSDSSEMVAVITSAMADSGDSEVRALETEALRVMEYVSRRVASTPVLRGMAAAMAFLERSLGSGTAAVAGWMWAVDESSQGSVFEFYKEQTHSSTPGQAVEVRPWNPLEIEQFYFGGEWGTAAATIDVNGRPVVTNVRTIAVLSSACNLVSSDLVPSCIPAPLLPGVGPSGKIARKALLERLGKDHRLSWPENAYHSTQWACFPHNEMAHSVAPTSAPLASDSGVGCFGVVFGASVTFNKMCTSLSRFKTAPRSKKLAAGKQLLEALVNVVLCIKKAARSLCAAMTGAAVSSFVDAHTLITHAVAALKETIDDEAADKSSEGRVLATHVLRLVALQANWAASSAEVDATATLMLAFGGSENTLPIACSSNEDPKLYRALERWVDVFRPDNVQATLVELIKEEQLAVSAATVGRLLRVTGRVNALPEANPGPGARPSGSTTHVVQPTPPLAVVHDATLAQRIQHTADMVAKEMYEAYSDASYGDTPPDGAPTSAYPLGAAEARRREMEATFIHVPGHSFIDPDAGGELFIYYVQLLNWLCYMRSQGGLQDTVVFQPLGDNVAYLQALLREIEADLAREVAPPKPVRAAEPATIFSQHQYASITEDEAPGTIGWGEPEATTSALYNQPQVEQEYAEVDSDFSALLKSALDSTTAPSQPTQASQQMFRETENQILEMLRAQDFGAMAAPVPPSHPLAMHPPPLDLGTLVTNHTVGLPAGGSAVTAEMATVLVYPIPQMPFVDDDDDDDSSPTNVPLIIVKALGETLGVRVGPATIVGEVARVVVPNHTVANRAVQLGRFICLGLRCRIIRNERIYDTSDNMRLNGRYFSYNKSTKGFDSAHYPLNPSFFYDQQLFKWRREQKQRYGRVPENDQGFEFKPPRSLESRPVHLQRDANFTGSSFTSSSASNMLSSRDFGAPGGGYGGFGNFGGSIGFGDGSTSGW